MGYINQIPLGNGGIWVEDMVDSINKSLDFMGYINQIPLGDSGIWVEDMVDSINKSLDLLGKVGDGTTFGRWTHDFCDLTNDSLNFMGYINQIPLGDSGIWVEDMVDSPM